MRTLLVAAVLLAGSSFVKAQDPAMQAAQQAQMAAQQASQQAQQQMQQAQQANQQATQNLTDALQAATACCTTPYIAKPTFSVKQGTYSKTLQVKIKTRSRGTIIYYTTDGWTPTASSNRYMGPITIDATTKLQAIAAAPGPNWGHSLVASAQYTLTGTTSSAKAVAPQMPASPVAPTAPMQTAPAATQNSVADDRPPVTSVDVIPVLQDGTAVRLAFTSDVTSKTAEVGDKITLTLSEDIRSGSTLLVAKGATAEAVVIQADKNGAGGAPGDITFQVNSLNVNGKMIRLRGGATLEGQPKPPNASILIPVVGGVAAILRHGTDADIKAGMQVTAYVDGDAEIALAK